MQVSVYEQALYNGYQRLSSLANLNSYKLHKVCPLLDIPELMYQQKQLHVTPAWLLPCLSSPTHTWLIKTCACRQSSPASSSGIPEYGTPSRSQSFMDMLSPMATPSDASSPLCTPGGRALGRGLDESPCISGSTSRTYSSGGLATKLNEETLAHMVCMRD